MHRDKHSHQRGHSTRKDRIQCLVKASTEIEERTSNAKMKMDVVNKLLTLALPTSEKKKKALHKICNNDSIAMMILTNAVQTKATAEDAKTMLFNCL